MSNAYSIATPNPFIRASYILLTVFLCTGTLVIPVAPRVALLSAAVIFGWSQIGGL